jgi:serine/threonine protein kinase
MDDPLHIGPFALGDRLGEGGMGAVYRGEHRSTGVPVALKVIRRAADGEARREFHREVQAHAGPQHPGIVYLFDYADIDARAAEASGETWQAGDPFVAMELGDEQAATRVAEKVEQVRSM